MPRSNFRLIVAFVIVAVLTVGVIEALGVMQLSHASSGPLSSEATVHWKKLLHFKDAHSKNSKSLITEKTFFISPNGHHDPDEEWNRTQILLMNYSALSVNENRFGRLQLPFHCAFPERTEFALKQLNLTLKHASPCPDFEHWISELKPEKISVVFSSFYPNNPASMFGHSFLRIHRKNNQSPLLDYGVNFAANATGPRLFGILYVLNGLFGGYNGYYDLSPYYMKLGEYHSQENRDLWEYELDLTETESRHLTQHLWELYHAGETKYYFLDENCAYEPLKLIEAIKPEWDLSRKTGFFVSPTSTFKILHSFTRNIRYIPALRKQERLLTKNQNQITENQSQSLIQKAKRYYYKKLLENSQFTVEDQKQYSTVLQEIAHKKITIDQTLYQTPAPDEYPPHEAHPATQVGLGFKRTTIPEKNLNQGTFRIRGGYHDRLNSWRAMLPGSQIRYLDFEFGIGQGFRINEATWFQIESLTPFTQSQKEFSWKAELRSKNPGRPFGGKAGLGLAMTPNPYRAISGIFVSAEADVFPVQLANLLELVHTQIVHPKFRVEFNGHLRHAWVERAQFNTNEKRHFQARAGIQSAIDIGSYYELRLGGFKEIRNQEFTLEMRRFF